MPFFFACQKVNSQAIDGSCRQTHSRTPLFLSCTVRTTKHCVVARNKLSWPEDDGPTGVWALDRCDVFRFQFTCTPAARHIFTCTVTPQNTQHRWHVYIGSRRVVRRKTYIYPRVLVHPLLHATLSTSSPSLSLLPLLCCCRLLLTQTCCEDPRRDGTSTEYPSSTGYEPKRVELNRILVKPQNQRIDDQDDIEELGVKKVVLLSSRFGRKHWDARLVRCWLRHCIYGNEGKMKDKHELTTLNEKAWWSSLLGILKYQGNLIRSVYRSEKQMHNEDKLVTQDEKAWWQVRLESSKFQGTLMRCFRPTVNRVRTRFPNETEATNRETGSRGVSFA